MNTDSQPTEPERHGSERHWHAVRAEETLLAFGSDAQTGLPLQEVAQNLLHFGPNALPEPSSRSLLVVFLHQFKSPLIYLLLAAAAFALALGHVNDAVVIFVVVLLNAVIGAFQEGRAERSLAALRRLASHKARVIRDGHEDVIEARDVVPGDVLLLSAGDAIAADARLLDGAALQIAEAALTGESLPVAKDLGPLAADTPLADRRNMVYAGTHVTAGRARAVVVATGLATELGHIAMLAGAAEQPMTPLERRIEQFGRYIIVIAAFLFALVNVVGVLRGVAFGDIVMIAISQVVGLIPEGLPVAMTIALAVGVQRMARRGAIVRRLAAVETLGSTTVICTDKTGTLTRNEMTVTALYLPGREEIGISGAGYEPQGTFTAGGRAITADSDADLNALLEAVVLCNDAELVGPDANDTRWRAIGDPTEAALLTVAVKGGLVPSDLRLRLPRRAEIPFDSAEKMMATQHDASGGVRIIIKGAPEMVVELCGSVRGSSGVEPLDDQAGAHVQAAAGSMADRALRVLAVAEVRGGSIDGRLGFAPFRSHAVLLGLVGQIDPPRLEVAEAVARCRAAGIRPVMVTGDHKTTAVAVARGLGLTQEGDRALDGRELEQLSDNELAEQIARVSVFARVHPAQKLRIVEAYQKQGEVVAMTGDGVNDAPALVRADVGVAMGITGTDVAKESAEVVVTDDNFATIVAAVEEGRLVYRNIKKIITLFLATSFAEVIVLLAAMFLGYPPPFAAVQILWNNLVTEGLITVNLAMEPREGDEMRYAPIPANEALLTRTLLQRVSFMALAIVVSTLGWFVFRLSTGVAFPLAQTETFTLLAVCEWFNVLCCRSERRSAFTWKMFANPWLIGGLLVANVLQIAVVFLAPLNTLFHTVPIGLEQAVAIGIVGSLVLWVEETRKLVMRRWRV